MPSRSLSVLFLAILCAAGMSYYHLALFIPRAIEERTAQGLGNGYSFGADFYPIWITSRESLLHHLDPYSPQTTRQIQIGLFGRPLDARHSDPPDDRAFANPAFAVAVFWPVALLPFSVIRIVLAVILLVATTFSVVLWLRALRLRAGPVILTSFLLLTLSSYAVLEGLFAEQMGLLVGFLLAASLAALVGQRCFLSGSLLALTLVKPQMMALIAAYLLFWSFAQWRSRRRFAAGFLIISAALGTSSLLVWPRWIPEWLRLLENYRQHSTPPLVEYLLGDSLGSRLGPILIGALLVSALAVAWRMRHVSPASNEFGLTASLLLAVTCITLLPGHAVYDHVVLLPGILWIAFLWRRFQRLSRPFRIVLGVSALALFWQWIFAPVVIALRPIVSPQLFNSTMLTLPIRTAASIPFGLFALLAVLMGPVMRKSTRYSGTS
jgi:hypothetical protein